MEWLFIILFAFGLLAVLASALGVILGLLVIVLGIVFAIIGRLYHHLSVYVSSKKTSTKTHTPILATDTIDAIFGFITIVYTVYIAMVAYHYDGVWWLRGIGAVVVWLIVSMIIFNGIHPWIIRRFGYPKPKP